MQNMFMHYRIVAPTSFKKKKGLKKAPFMTSGILLDVE
jgi:hypothetical protein